ncbi:MAG TPA: hypothetical protein DCP37_07770 [Dehalococcoidia bacterium]|jgi:type 1 glutamine amidotransferase|nr:ThuA domain-containing protein [SAR202 cluster bacterium]HAL47638.1 hypothetical protein [Dehalococcoidia bacterium]|tara:strand:+ start:2512 stop:3459 length:948 start_codon:yes stop_codon:yes gene_type:complete
MNRQHEDLWITYEGGQGPGAGKHIVLVSGDEEYRSEESLPMLAKILAVRHGFKCTVLFAVDPETGAIDPETLDNIPGLHHLDDADLMIMLIRFRELPDEQMKHIIDYTNRGKPVIGLRTATHAFKYVKDPQSSYAKYSCEDEQFEGGYGRQVLGETWVGHHSNHGVESTRGVIDEANRTHPVLKGVRDIWCPTDVYAVGEITGDPRVLVWGQVLQGMDPRDGPNLDKSRMPIAWVKSYTGDDGNTCRVFCTTMGASVDLENAGLRRLLVNACYWGMEMEDRISDASNVDYVGDYNPTAFGYGGFTKGVRPSEHAF